MTQSQCTAHLQLEKLATLLKELSLLVCTGISQLRIQQVCARTLLQVTQLHCSAKVLPKEWEGKVKLQEAGPNEHRKLEKTSTPLKCTNYVKPYICETIKVTFYVLNELHTQVMLVLFQGPDNNKTSLQ